MDHYTDPTEAFGPLGKEQTRNFARFDWHGIADALTGVCTTLDLANGVAIFQTPRYGRIIIWQHSGSENYLRVQAERLYLKPAGRDLREELEDDHALMVTGITFVGRRSIIRLDDANAKIMASGTLLYQILLILEQVEDRYHPTMPHTIDVALTQVQRVLDKLYEERLGTLGLANVRLQDRITDNMAAMRKEGAGRDDVDVIEQVTELLDRASWLLEYTAAKPAEADQD